MKTTSLALAGGLLALSAPAARSSALLKPTSGVTQALAPKSLFVDATLRGNFAQTTLTTIYANPNQTRIEADFLYSAPAGATVTGFAYWYGAEKVTARVVEKKRAAKIYGYITSRMRDPALIEMVGRNTFRARIFPVEARADLKIEIKLAQTLPNTRGGALWTYPLRDETRNAPLPKLSVRLRSSTKATSNIGAFKNGVLKLERSNFSARDDARALVSQPAAPLRASLVAARDGGNDGFFALSLAPNAPMVRPKFAISGVSTYNVSVPTIARLAAHRSFVVTGRYRGSGRATVSLGGQTVNLDFPASVEKGNVASHLWAAQRIESLSTKESNRVAVMALSKRFGVPSKWTSWLAIPEEERRTFKKQMLASDRESAARAYAQAIARGDQKGAQIQKKMVADVTAELLKIDRDYSSNEELQPLANYLNDELRRVKRAVVAAKYGSASAKQRAQWTTWARNLEKAGADDGADGVEMPVYVLEDELRIASRLLMLEIENGRGQSRQSRGLRSRLKELASTKVARNYGWNENTFLSEQADVRANALAMDYASNRASSKPNAARQQQILARLGRLSSFTDSDTKEILAQANRGVWRAKLEAAAQKVALENAAGRQGIEAKKHRDALAALERKSTLSAKEFLENAHHNVASSIQPQLSAELAAGRGQGARAKQLEKQLQRLAQQSGEKPQAFVDEAVAQGARDVANQLAARLSESQNAEELQLRLTTLANRSDQKPDELLKEASSNVAQRKAQELAAEIRAKREDGVRARELQKSLNALKTRGVELPLWTVYGAWETRIQPLAEKLFAEVAENGADSPRAKILRGEGERLAKKGGVNFADVARWANSGVRRELALKQRAEVLAGRGQGPTAKELQTQRSRLSSLDFVDASDWQHVIDTAWQGRAHEVAYKLLQAQKTEPGNSQKISALQNELKVLANQTRESSSDVLQVERERFARNEPMLAADQYRVRAGDPLISVSAPANCRRVVAIMPDGTLLPLAFNAKLGTWEARFDVPTWAQAGRYKVQILLVDAEGARRRLTMNFVVDDHAPSGKGALENKGATWNLTLQTDEHTRRVVALTPWNSRIELPRGANHTFAQSVAVPAAFQNRKAAVRFILTDAAHNRTEVFVDWN